MTALDLSPSYSAENARRFASEVFGVDVANVTPLPSERDQNFLLRDSNSKRWVLKISNGQESPEFIDGQNQMMVHLAGRIEGCPQVLPALDGKLWNSVCDDKNNQYIARLVSFVEGTPLADVKYRSPRLLKNLGLQICELTTALEGFNHPAFDRSFHWDLANGVDVVQSRLHLIKDISFHTQVEHCLNEFSDFATPVLHGLPKSVVQNDANDGNVIVSMDNGDGVVATSVAGIIDFGDAVYSWTISELAIATAYAILDCADPMTAACDVVRGYADSRSLSDDELLALFGLIRLRLCVSAVMAAEQQQTRPDDEYLSVSQQPIRNTLPALCEVPYGIATEMLRQAAAKTTSAKPSAFVKWLEDSASACAFPIAQSADRQLEVIDLSAGTTLLAGDPTRWSAKDVGAAIESVVMKDNASIPVGRYLEPRLLYAADQFASSNTGSEDGAVGLFETERRTVHLGIDLFAAAGTPVVAVFDGIVERVDACDAPLDYGTLVILRHKPADGQVFYSLYGHLSSGCRRLQPGQPIRQGDAIGELGDYDDNGGWPPHLHFQLATDLLRIEHNFPGVCRHSQQAAWSAICPDPSVLLQIPGANFQDTNGGLNTTLDRRKQMLGNGLSIAYDRPLNMVRGTRHFLYDHSGHRFLDAYNNVPHVGHAHPRIVKALAQQASVLNTNTRYLHDLQSQFAEELAATMPASLSVCYFVNSASEANELSLRLAQAATGQKDMIVLEGAYHGHSTNLIHLSPYKHDGPGGSGAPDWVHTALLADTFRGPHRNSETAGELYADDVQRIVRKLQQDGKGVCGFIAESCPSVGGQIIFPKGYLNHVYQHVKAAGGVCIADEVQTGYGRLGKYFYGFEQQGVEPDIVVLGKPIGNGHPLAAVVTTAEIDAAFDSGMEFFSTFGGNTVSCAVGVEVLRTVSEDRLPENAAAVGEQLLDGLRTLQQSFPIIGDVRGMGLFLGVELIKDKATLEPAAAEATYIVNRMRAKGILIGTDGSLHNVLKIRPPITFDSAAATELLSSLRKVLTELDCLSC